MKIKIGDKIYDGEKEPIMVILSDCDKANIANMSPECGKYCEFPESSDEKEIEKWMKD